VERFYYIGGNKMVDVTNDTYFEIRQEFLVKSLKHLEQFNRKVNDDVEKLSIMEMEDFLIDMVNCKLKDEYNIELDNITKSVTVKDIIRDIISNDWLFGIAIKCITESIRNTEEEELNKFSDNI
jgi:hypothetical protein